MQARAYPGAIAMAAMMAGLLVALPMAGAQDIRITAPRVDEPPALRPSSPAAEPEALDPLTPEESALLEQALLFDPVELGNAKPVRRPRTASLSKPQRLDVSRNENPDGSSTVVVKQPLTSEWDAKVGADLNLAAPPPITYQPGRPLPGMAPDDHGSGAAWASVGVVPNFASVDARVDPVNDQGKIGTTLKHSIPVGGKLSVTVQDRYSVTEALSQPSQPAPQSGATQVFSNERSVKLDIKPTGTTLGAGFATASNDPVTHNTLSAEQKLVGPLHVKAAVSDVDQPNANKSISAGFKLTW